MDARVEGWVVTPRRGKAVEINALFYNALRLLEGWVRDAHGEDAARPLAAQAARTRSSFNQRFWFEEGGTVRRRRRRVGRRSGVPAQSDSCVFADLPGPRAGAMGCRARDVRRELLTPYGLRSLAPGCPGYQSKYYGNLRSRDAAYHQGTVWAWLDRSIRRCLAAGVSKRLGSGTSVLGGLRRSPERGRHRLHQRDLRRRDALHPARLYLAGVERRRSAAGLAAPHDRDAHIV